MARRRKKESKPQVDETLVDIAEVKDQAQSFIDQNQTTIFGVLVALVVVIGGLFAYNNYYKGPRVQESANQMYQAQLQFEKDSFAIALENPGGGYGGFLDIIENYSGTPAANTANYYASVCYLNLGDYDKAIEYMNDFSPKGDLMPIMKYGVLGDAYSEKGEMDKAISNYNKAISQGGNDVLVAHYLKKVGLWNEKNGNMAAAQEAYQKIKKNYPNSPDGNGIEKFLARVSK